MISVVAEYARWDLSVTGDLAFSWYNKFVTGVKIKATDDSKLNDSTGR